MDGISNNLNGADFVTDPALDALLDEALSPDAVGDMPAGLHDRIMELTAGKLGGRSVIGRIGRAIIPGAIAAGVALAASVGVYHAFGPGAVRTEDNRSAAINTFTNRINKTLADAPESSDVTATVTDTLDDRDTDSQVQADYESLRSSVMDAVNQLNLPSPDDDMHLFDSDEG